MHRHYHDISFLFIKKIHTFIVACIIAKQYRYCLAYGAKTDLCRIFLHMSAIILFYEIDLHVHFCFARSEFFCNYTSRAGGRAVE